ncbi:MAG TPA: PAS domain-containing sensor histidine kinase [Bauldia sp.]|nr:PAS domain-containing sensor histidine kinase [Bauldia sp.]
MAEPIPEGGKARKSFDFTRLIRASGYVAVIAALGTVGTTFFVLMGLTPIAPTPDVVFAAMLANGALVAFLIFVIAWELVSLAVADRRGRAAARLHIRIVALFSLVATAPAVLLAVSASFSLDHGLDNWFSTRTRAIVDNSLSIAQAYAGQQTVQLRIDTLAVKAALERQPNLLHDDPQQFETFFADLAQDRNLPGVFLIDDTGGLIAQATSADRSTFPPPSPSAIASAHDHPGEVAIIAPGNTNIIGAIAALSGPDNYLVYTTRPIDPQVAGYLTLTSETVAQYRILQASRFGVQIAFGILFLGITVVVLLSAIWLGIGFANRLVTPIRRLIDAAKQVSAGNLKVTVHPRRSDGDVGALGVTFNAMTAQLRTQRQQLVAASELNDSRRRFTEAVLSGVTAGVIGIDAEGRVTIANRTALQLIGAPERSIGLPLTDIAPELGKVLGTAMRDGRPEHHDQVTLIRGGRERTINIRVTTERATGQAHGYVVTLDDITDLVAAQRSTAWADIARRIAHEIKNPLTPIQLSAERLKRKFGKAITEDREVFDQCTDTIIRQVGDIGRMVDEFSSFARMPKPTMAAGNLSEVIREAVFLVSVSQPDITFDTNVPSTPLMGRFDARLMGQALGNLVKNATEAIAAVPPSSDYKGHITVDARTEGNTIVVDVIDNGIGLPRENRHRLLEPYVTTREKGTGLGLAIVTKIIEEHSGHVELLDAPAVAAGGRGAMIRITLPKLAEAGAEAGAEAAPAQADGAAGAKARVE